MARIVILGAGLTGLSTAYHLEQEGCNDYLIFEKEATPGGLCRSVTVQGCTFDYTGHLLHSNDATTRPLVEMCLGKDNITIQQRNSFIHLNGIQTPYPFQMYLHGHSPALIAECIQGFIQRTTSQRQPKMFTDWVEHAFGKGFGKYFFYPYQRKIFSYSPRLLTAGWTGRFVPKTDLVSIIQGALTPTSNNSIGYNATFLYPHKGGINTLITGLAQRLTRQIHTEFCATRIDTQKKIIYFSNGHTEPYDKLVSTLPLDELLYLLEGTHTHSLHNAAQHLLCTSVLNNNLGIQGSSLPNASWIYYPENTPTWYRMGFPHTFSEYNAPKGVQTIYTEVSYIKQPRNLNLAFSRIEKEVTRFFNIEKEAIIARAPLFLRHAYVIYNTWRDAHVPRILKRLQDDYTIHSIGRYGAWKYASMQEALTDGKTTANDLIKNMFIAYPSRRFHEARTLPRTSSSNRFPTP